MRILAGQELSIEARLTDLLLAPRKVEENPNDGLKYVYIPPGTFTMGCSPGITNATRAAGFVVSGE